VKPLSEQGFRGLVFENWYGVFAPAKTPDAIAEAIGAGWKHVMSDSEVRSRFASMALEPVWDGPQHVSQAIASDLKRWRELAARAGIKSPN
jgi:tripartite-type tricarboxylate transporter receptor subunit TctC